MRVDANSVNWLTARNVAADVGDRAIHHAGVVVEDAQRHDLAREPIAVVVAVVGRDAGEHEQARADGADDRPSTATEASRTRWTSARIDALPCTRRLGSSLLDDLALDVGDDAGGERDGRDRLGIAPAGR